MKYETGTYQISYFSEYGNKIKTKQATGFIEARNKINKYLNKNPDHSAVILHVLWNSKDKNNKWEYKNKNDNGQRNGPKSSKN